MNYNELTRRLKAVSPDAFEFEAEILLEAFSDKKIAYILAHREEEIGSQELISALERRENREPLSFCHVMRFFLIYARVVAALPCQLLPKEWIRVRLWLINFQKLLRSL